MSLQKSHPDRSLFLLYVDSFFEVSKQTHFGITMSSNLTLRAHIFSVYQKAGKRLNMLAAISYKVG